MVRVAHLIPLFPLAAFLINIFIGRCLKKNSAILAIAASSVALVLSIVTFIGLLHGQGSYAICEWISFGETALDLGVMVDPLTVAMLLVVSLVGLLIQIYSVGYMAGDARFSRFFAYLSLFMAAMLGLLLADNFLMLFMCWEGVGVCSYLLISFWFEKISAARAGMKAFITTKVGDIAMFLGMMLIFCATKSFYFHDLAHLPAGGGDAAMFGVAALLIFGGAMGKSAQFPLHTWLPDAMEGPTSVSALIHAATMVAAGVYLVARTFMLFAGFPSAMAFVAVVGAITALMAASIATVTNDIKRVLAYSTISQLGLMMLGLGAGGYSAGVFHLITHAFFKALLFLCAGSIIHGAHTQDIREMGGILPKMKITGATLIIGGLAIAGVPPFAGFWSKDEILSEALKNQHPVLFAAALITSLLTAYYMFRMIFMVLFGRSRAHSHPHESPGTMTVPLMVLAGFAVFIGFIGSPFTGYALQNFLHSTEPHGHEAASMSPDYPVMLISTLAALLGIGLAYVLHLRNYKILPLAVRKKFSWLYNLLSHKYYLDEIYDAAFVQPSNYLAELFFRFDAGVVDAAVNLTGRLTVIISDIKGWIDINIVDRLVNAVARLVGVFSAGLRLMQTGQIQHYLLAALIGLGAMIFAKSIGGLTCIFRF